MKRKSIVCLINARDFFSSAWITDGPLIVDIGYPFAWSQFFLIEASPVSALLVSDIKTHENCTASKFQNSQMYVFAAAEESRILRENSAIRNRPSLSLFSFFDKHVVCFSFLTTNNITDWKRVREILRGMHQRKQREIEREEEREQAAAAWNTTAHRVKSPFSAIQSHELGVNSGVRKAAKRWFENNTNSSNSD